MVREAIRLKVFKNSLQSRINEKRVEGRREWERLYEGELIICTANTISFG